MPRGHRRVISLGASGYKVMRQGPAAQLWSRAGLLSWYDPRQPFTGFAWDAHTASSLLSVRELRTVLILGLGGGTIARQIRLLAPHAIITGVEKEHRVLVAARRHFRLDDWHIDVVEALSQDYLRRTRRSFDLILDDVWPTISHEGRPVRSHVGWARLVRSCLNPGAVYAVTVLRRSEDADDLPVIIERMGRIFQDTWEVRPRDGESTVVAVGSGLLTGQQAHSRRRQLPPPIAEGLSHVRYHRR